MKKILFFAAFVIASRAMAQQSADSSNFIEVMPSYSFTVTIQVNANKIIDRRLLGAKSIDYIMIGDVIVKDGIVFDPHKGEILTEVFSGNRVFISFKK